MKAQTNTRALQVTYEELINAKDKYKNTIDKVKGSIKIIKNFQGDLMIWYEQSKSVDEILKIQQLYLQEDDLIQRKEDAVVELERQLLDLNREISKKSLPQ